jgi:MHS family proline/betaine transporter-like MFS transporter
MIAAYLIQRTGEDLAPAYFLILCAVISLGVIWTMRETVREPLR